MLSSSWGLLVVAVVAIVAVAAAAVAGIAIALRTVARQALKEDAPGQRTPVWKRLAVAIAAVLTMLGFVALTSRGDWPHTILGFLGAFAAVVAVPVFVALLVRMPRTWWRFGG